MFYYKYNIFNNKLCVYLYFSGCYLKCNLYNYLFTTILHLPSYPLYTLLFGTVFTGYGSFINVNNKCGSPCLLFLLILYNNTPKKLISVLVRVCFCFNVLYIMFKLVVVKYVTKPL